MQRSTAVLRLNPGLKIHFCDHRRQELFEPKGIVGRFQRRYRPLIAPILHFQDRQDEIEVQAVAGLSRHLVDREIRSYVNTRETTQHGVHVDGFLSGFADALAVTLKTSATADLMEKLQHRLSAIVLVNLKDPQFASPTIERLSSAKVKPIVRAITGKAVADFLRDNPEFVDRLIES